MKLSVSAFRAQATAQNKLLASRFKRQYNYGATASSFTKTTRDMSDGVGGTSEEISEAAPLVLHSKRVIEQGEPTKHEQLVPPKTKNSPHRDRGTKSNQRWMKLRTSVQLSGAMQKSKATLKREDSFLRKFSTRQIPELQETVDTGDDGEGDSGRETSDLEQPKKKRRKRSKRKHPFTLINPDGNFFFYWLFIVTFSVLYNLWTLIVRQSFPEFQAASPSVWFGMDSFTDLVFLVDFGVQLRTGYLEQGLIVEDAQKLACHYIHSREFLFDLFALFPISLLKLFNINTEAAPILRFPRFFKVYRVYRYYYMAEARTTYPNLWRVVNLIHILLILAHWFGCFYYLISEAEGFRGDWAYPYRPGDNSSLTRKYLGSLYWSTLTLTTIGDLPTPDTNLESKEETAGLPRITRRGHKSRLLQFNSSTGYLFTISSYLIGVFIFATIVGQVGNVITNRNANRLEFERLLDGAKTYMRHHRVPGGMKRRVLRWYDYSWSRGRIHGGGDLNSALALLPDKLKTDLALHVNLSVLKKVTIFQECQPEFLHDLVLKMKASIFTPGDLICRKGEVAREMFIIADGILEVISETGRVVTTMKEGDFFGEIGILNLDGLNRRTADVRSLGYSELFSLSREDVLSAMKDYPEAQEIMQSLGRKRLMEARNMNKSLRAGHQKKVTVCPEPTSPTTNDLSPQNPNKKMSDKLKLDVKEWKTAFRIAGKCSRSKPDCLELQPFSKQDSKISGSTTKATLCRMARVFTDNNSCEEETQKSPEHEVIGAGLPLMQRLKLLKEKQQKQEKKEATVKSPESDLSETKSTGNKTGLTSPPSQKLENVKNVEEKSNNNPITTSTSISKPVASVKTQLRSSSNLQKTFRKQNSDIYYPSLDQNTRRKINSVLEDDSGEEKDREVYENSRSVVEESDQGSLSWKRLQQATVLSETSQSKSFRTNESLHASNIKPASAECSNLSSDTKVKTCSFSDKNEIIQSESFHQVAPPLISRKPKSRNPLASSLSLDVSQLGGRNRYGVSKSKDTMKRYSYIDDLSPEYKILPFVKKLKVLNDRIKLAEYEDLMTQMYSSSESTAEEHSVVSEARSDLSGQLKKVLSTVADTEASVSSNGNQKQLNSNISPESNETAERRHLKSILKEASMGSSLGHGSAGSSLDTVCKTVSSPEMKKLMRAQTVEGYVARHSKLKNYQTFIQVDLSSPPPSPNERDSSETQYTVQESTHSNFPREGYFQDNMSTNNADNLEMKNREIDNLRSRFISMEIEIKNKDMMIAQLEHHIEQLQDKLLQIHDDLMGEETEILHPFMRNDSVVTVVDSDEITTEDPPNIYPTELAKEIQVNIEESDSDTNDELSFNRDWEVLMLAEEMEKREKLRKRPVSFDLPHASYMTDAEVKRYYFSHNRGYSTPLGKQLNTLHKIKSSGRILKDINRLKRESTIAPEHFNQASYSDQPSTLDEYNQNGRTDGYSQEFCSLNLPNYNDTIQSEKSFDYHTIDYVEEEIVDDPARVELNRQERNESVAQFNETSSQETSSYSREPSFSKEDISVKSSSPQSSPEKHLD